MIVKYLSKVNKKLIVYLSGGMGNQLFQYFFGMSWSKKLNRKLYVENKTSFFTDFAFKRKFEIPLKSSENTRSYILSFLFFRIMRKIFKKKKFKIFNNLFITECELKKNRKILEENSYFKNIFIIGDFQNEKYFEKYKIDIKNSLNFEKIKNNKIIEVLKKLDLKNTVAIGMRFYEELSIHKQHLVGDVTPLSFYNEAIGLFEKKLENPKYIIFSFKDHEMLKKLNISKDKVVFINDQTIQCKNIEKLLMMSNFKNFIISNSSFYWWAAYFAEMKYEKINMVATNNFFDDRTIPDRWKTLD
jgi:hypothetical protein